MSERVSVDPKISHGQVCIKGTRRPVHQVIRMLANGDKIEELLEDYLSLKVEDIYACLDYAAELVCTLPVTRNPQLAPCNPTTRNP